MMNKIPFLYKFGRRALGPFFKWYYKPTIIGKENIPKSGAILIVGNHKHLYDQCLSIISTKRYIRYMAKKEYFDNKKTKWFFSAVGCISVDRQNHDGKAKDEAIKTLKEGGAIGLFPEGTRNGVEKGEKSKDGAAFFAVKTGARVIPVGITGGEKAFDKMTIRYGEPMDFSNRSKDELDEITEEIMKKIIELAK